MDNKNKNANAKNKPTKTAIDVLKTENFNDGVVADPNGSYTGVPYDKNEMPVQDADDL